MGARGKGFPTKETEEQLVVKGWRYQLRKV